MSHENSKNDTDIFFYYDVPQLYQIVIINDNHTPRDFVCFILMVIFRLQTNNAVELMFAAEDNGFAKFGKYTKEIAETKTHISMANAKKFELPFKCYYEPI